MGHGHEGRHPKGDPGWGMTMEGCPDPNRAEAAGARVSRPREAESVPGAGYLVTGGRTHEY
jgi:hypothetical protein